MKNTPLLTKSLRAAAALQKQYNALGAASTQNVRNPLPLHALTVAALTVAALTTAVDPLELIATTETIRFTHKGKKYVVKRTGHEFAKNVLPPATFADNGKTINQVFADLGDLLRPARVGQDRDYRLVLPALA